MSVVADEKRGERLVATETFEVEYEGALETIVAGVSYVSEGHEIARRFPGRFKKAQPQTGSRKRLHARRSQVRPTARVQATIQRPESWRIGRDADIVLEDGAFRDVPLSWSVLAKIESDIHRVAGSGVETGGYLLGRTWDSVALQTGPGPGSRPSSRQFQLDGKYAREWLNVYPDLRIVGDWHLHPSYDGVPSDADLRGWAGHLNRDLDGYLGIIATKGECGYTLPRLHAFVMYRDGKHCVCEPVRIREL